MSIQGVKCRGVKCRGVKCRGVKCRITVLSQMTFGRFEEEFRDFSTTLSRLATTNYVWLACDILQIFPQSAASVDYNKCVAVLEFSKVLIDGHGVSLETNLRNTYDMSRNLLFLTSFIMNHLLTIAIVRFKTDLNLFLLTLREIRHKEGHYIHGPRAILHIFNSRYHDLIERIYYEEVDKVKTESALYDSGIMTITGRCSPEISDLCKQICYKEKCHVLTYSLEWPSVIVVHEMSYRAIDLINHLSILYLCMSRATVYCSIFLIPAVGVTSANTEMSDILAIIEKMSHALIIRH